MLARPEARLPGAVVLVHRPLVFQGKKVLRAAVEAVLE
jgi:hypothetical protein